MTAAREAALRGRSVLLLEARDRLGGRTWSANWQGERIEYGGAWVHWHQPHTFSEITRAGLALTLGAGAERAAWYVDGRRREGTIAQRDAVARRGWDRFVEGVETALPLPHDPLRAPDALTRFDRLTIAQRLDELELTAEERDVLTAELESLAHAPLHDAGAVSVLRWHALSGYSLELTQATGSRVTIERGTGALLEAIASAAPVEHRLGAPVAAVTARGDEVQAALRDGSGFRARSVVVTVPLNALGAIAFAPALPEAKQRAIALGQASRGVNHDWLADEFSRGTWAIHRPGWYEHHHAAMRVPEGRVALAGSDLADGWAGFIDGAIESGLRAGAWAARISA